METQVNYVRVGAFVISGFLAMILFIVWINKGGLGESVQPYDVFFKGSVSGLKVGSTVHYRGVPIGAVSAIKINPENVEEIQVRVNIQKEIMIKEDMCATLETQGLTGISYIQIRGGSSRAKKLTDIGWGEIPVIPSKSSFIEEVSASIPEILKKMTRLISEIREIFNDENRAAFAKTMKNIEELTSYFKPANGKEKDTFILELTKTISDLDTALLEISSLSKEFTNILKDNRQNVREFTTIGLNSFTRFMSEGRESLATLRRVGESLERSPSRFFYNDPQQGVPVR